MELLLAAGADGECRNIEGRTCLWIAASSGQIAAVVLLLDYGADPGERVVEMLSRYGSGPCWSSSPAVEFQEGWVTVFKEIRPGDFFQSGVEEERRQEIKSLLGKARRSRTKLDEAAQAKIVFGSDVHE